MTPETDPTSEPSTARPLLTFDDGPGPDTEALLEVLAAHRCRAVFFLVGERVSAHTGLVRRMVDEGHWLGNHSWDHPDLRELSLFAVRDQLTATNAVIRDACGVAPRYFRPPFGHGSPAIRALAGSLGLATMMWTVGTDDWRDPGVAAIETHIRSSEPGDVVLLHDGPQHRHQTLDAVARVLAGGWNRT